MGDAVLGLIICSYLYEKFDSLNEGQLSKIKSHLVSKPVLYAIAEKMKIGDYLFLSKAEDREGGRKKPSIIADAVESIFGAVFLDQGLQKVKDFILYYYEDFLNSISLKSLDYKTTLQEFLQKKYKKLPVYKIVRETGPPHRRIFEISVASESKIFEKGFGKSKKEAEQSAAKTALKKLKLI